MPAAIDFTTVAGISRRSDDRIALYSINFAEEVSFDLHALPTKPRHHWSDYPLGVITVLKSAGAEMPAFSMSLAGDVPLGSGLSSSAAIEVAGVAPRERNFRSGKVSKVMKSLTTACGLLNS